MSRLLLPAPRKDGQDGDEIPTKSAPQIVFPKIQLKGRTHVAIACNSCRKSKSKCDGTRPACTKCLKGKKKCEYVTQADTLAPQVLKKKHRQLEERNADLQDLLDYLANMPLGEAGEILRRVREGEDPQALVKLLRDSHVLLQFSDPQTSAIDIARSRKLPPVDVFAESPGKAP